MLRDEFLIMQRQDLVTAEDENLNTLCDVFEEVLKSVPSNFEIDSKKTVKECYDKMYVHAQKNQKNHSYCFNTKAVIEFVSNYLEVDVLEQKTDYVDLTDFL